MIKIISIFNILLLLLVSCGSDTTTTNSGSAIPTTKEISGTVSYNEAIDNKYKSGTNVAVSLSLNNGITGTHTLSIAPPLTGGLSFNPSSGAISGTPTGVFSNRYTVTATGTGDYTGAISTSIIIAIEAKKTITGTISYTQNKYQGYTNVAVSLSLNNGITGTHDLSIAPPLTGGLSFNPSSGAISGTPTSVFSNRYTVTATGTGDYTGAISTSIIIAIEGITSGDSKSFTIVEKNSIPVELTVSNHDPSTALVGATNWSSSDTSIATVSDGVVRFAATTTPTNVTIAATIGKYSTNKVVSIESATNDGTGIITTKGSHTNLIISDSVETIGEAYWKRQLTSVRIGDSVREIGYNAFYNSQLISLTIPDSVTKIGNNAFAKNQLTSLIIPDSMETIEYGAFANNQLTSVIIPDSMMTIRQYVFANNQLTNVKIGSSVTNIYHNAFANNKLTSVIIPNSVVTIDREVFADNQLTSVTIPSSVKTIWFRAFKNNPLTSVTLSVSLYTNFGVLGRIDRFGTNVKNWYKLDGTKH